MNQLDYNSWLLITQQRARTARFIDKGKPSNAKQRQAIVVGLQDLSRRHRLRILSCLLNREVSSTKALSFGEASLILEEMRTPEFKAALERKEVAR